MLVAGATKLKSSEIWAMIKAKSSICFQMEHRQCAAYRNSMKTKAIEKSWKKKNIRPQRIWMKWMDCSNEKWQRATLNDYARYDGHKHLFRSFCASSYLLFWMVAETKRTNIECVYQLWQSNRKTETAHSGKNVSTFLPQFFACIFRIFSLFASLCKQNSMLYKFQWKWLLFFVVVVPLYRVSQYLNESNFQCALNDTRDAPKFVCVFVCVRAFVYIWGQARVRPDCAKHFSLM